MRENTTPLLQVKDLTVDFTVRDKSITVVRGVTLTVNAGEIIGLVGESGWGKSVFAKALMRILPPSGKISGGSVFFHDQDVAHLDNDGLRSLRGERMAMIFQDPMGTLNPVMRIDAQMMEAILSHHKISKTEARQKCLEALSKVGIPSPKERLRSYPHQLSGGMRQRVAIATALLNSPDLILADEATTALDVTIQAQILHEVRKLCEESGASLIWITHDLAVVSGIADQVAVMYAGRIVEYGSTKEIVENPRHPYTKGLIESVPDADERGQKLHQIPGLMPNPASLPGGCSFHPRCTRALAICEQTDPSTTTDKAHVYRCHNPCEQKENL